MSVCASALLDVHQRNRECGVALPSVQCTNTPSMPFSLAELGARARVGEEPSGSVEGRLGGLNVVYLSAGID